ncbi:unnamed protein product [Brachionus calyciflorus]|uniref:Uncharacterized protein n=1 Tax=Brachionus calyciflorus TaxID=104777 RepID=A0A813U0K1_9BILA|nr:unnamed protein product [Brachionus calyciflorus]
MTFKKEEVPRQKRFRPQVPKIQPIPYYYPYPIYTYQGFTYQNPFDIRPAESEICPQSFSMENIKQDENFPENRQDNKERENNNSEREADRNFPMKFLIAHFILMAFLSLAIIIIQMGLNFKGVKYGNVYSGYWVGSFNLVVAICSCVASEFFK